MSRQRAYVALLRGINVSGNRTIAMKPLEALCVSIGWTGVRTHLQTGNILFRAPGSTGALERQLEQAIHERLGFPITVVVRHAATFSSYVATCPFAAQTATDASYVLLYVTKRPSRPDTAEALTARALAGETVVVTGEVLWIYFPNGVGSSKLTPALIDRAIGSAATGRNWNTASKIQQLCSE